MPRIQARAALPLLAMTIGLGALASGAQSQLIIVDDDDPIIPSLIQGVAMTPDGGTILVREGTYDEFVQVDGKSVRIVAEAGAAVKITRPFTVSNLAADQSVELRGLQIDVGVVPISVGGKPLSLSNCAGSVWIQDCDLFTGDSPELSAVNVTNLIVKDCTLEGSSFGFSGGPYIALPAVDLEDTNSTWIGCSLRGANAVAGDNFFPNGEAAAALRIAGGEHLLMDSVLVAGDGAQGYGDAQLPICIPPTAGGSAVFVEQGPAASIRVVDTLLQPGVNGSPLAGCPPNSLPDPQAVGGPGASSTTTTLLPGPFRGLEVNSPVSEGGLVQFAVTAPAGELGFLLFSAGLNATPIAVAGLDFLLADPVVVQFLGTAGATGEIQAQSLVPDFLEPPTIPFLPNPSAARFYLQAVTFDPAQLTPNLTSAATLTAFDAGV